jgi:hypothetical protein
MAGFIQNIIWNSVEGFVEAGTRSAGDFAGNALIKAGDMIENGGRSVGNGKYYGSFLSLGVLATDFMKASRKKQQDTVALYQAKHTNLHPKLFHQQLENQ